MHVKSRGFRSGQPHFHDDDNGRIGMAKKSAGLVIPAEDGIFNLN